MCVYIYMPEKMPDTISEYMSDRMLDIMSEYVSDRKSVGGDHWKKITILHDARILNHIIVWT